MYYSQHEQDRWLDEYVFKAKRDGVFVDIGALDGLAISNTKFFEETRGWTGFAIEPKPDMYAKLVQNRSCKCFGGVLTNRPDPTIEFLDVEGWAECLSGITDSYDPAHLKRIDSEIQAHGGSKKVIQVPNFRFNDIIDNPHIDYVSLDTEGSELEILESIDFTKYQIDCFSIEDNYGNSAVNDLMTSRGYKPLIRLACDLIWIRNDR